MSISNEVSNSNQDKPPQRLTSEEKFALFCYCIRSPQNPAGWTVDPVTGRSVCWACSKPAPMTGIRICCECNSEFIDFDQKRWIVWPNNEVTEAYCYCIDCP